MRPLLPIVALCVLAGVAALAWHHFRRARQQDELAWDFSGDTPVTLNSILPHTNYSAAIMDGARFEDPSGGTIAMKRLELGTLFLPTGQIIACDPGNLTIGNWRIATAVGRASLAGAIFGRGTTLRHASLTFTRSRRVDFRFREPAAY